MTESGGFSEKEVTGQHSDVHFTPHHSWPEFKSLFKKYFVLVFLIALVPVTVLASYSTLTYQSSAKVSSQTKPPTAAKSPTPAATTPTIVTGTGNLSDIVMDNDDPGVEYDRKEWLVLKKPKGFIGNDYLRDKKGVEGNKRFIFRPNIPQAQSYTVYMRWPKVNKRASNVPVTIQYAGGSNRIIVNQKSIDKEWYPLGTYKFNAGQAGRVVINTKLAGEKINTNGFVIIDAVRFVPAIDVIIDNTESDKVITSPDTTFWKKRVQPKGYYGSDYLLDIDKTNKAVKSVQFTPNLPVTGRYRVYLRYVAADNRDNQIPVDILHSEGTSSKRVNQKKNGGQWNLLGTYLFNQGSTGNAVIIRSKGTDGMVAADAVRFITEASTPNANTSAPVGGDELALLAAGGGIKEGMDCTIRSLPWKQRENDYCGKQFSQDSCDGSVWQCGTDSKYHYVGYNETCRCGMGPICNKTVGGEPICGNDVYPAPMCQPYSRYSPDDFRNVPESCGTGSGCLVNFNCALSNPQDENHPGTETTCVQDPGRCSISAGDPSDDENPGDDDPTPTVAADGPDCDKHRDSSSGCTGKDYGDICPINPDDNGKPYKCIQTASNACACTTSY